MGYKHLTTLLRRGCTAALLLGCLLKPGSAAAGGWTQPVRGGYARLEVATRTTGDIFDADGERAPYSIGGGPGRYTSTELRGYAEYGVSPLVTLLGALDWKRARISETAARFTTTGFGDLRLGVRVGLAQGGAYPSAIQLEMAFPSGYDAADTPALGAGRNEATLSAQVGHGFGAGYLAADLGYRLRTRHASDQVVYSGEVGLHGPWRVGLRLALRGHAAVQSPGGGPIDPAVAERSSLAGTGALVVALTPRLELEAGATRAISGRNTLRGSEYTLALAARR